MAQARCGGMATAQKKLIVTIKRIVTKIQAGSQKIEFYPVKLKIWYDRLYVLGVVVPLQ